MKNKETCCKELFDHFISLIERLESYPDDSPEECRKRIAAGVIALSIHEKLHSHTHGCMTDMLTGDAESIFFDRYDYIGCLNDILKGLPMSKDWLNEIAKEYENTLTKENK